MFPFGNVLLIVWVKLSRQRLSTAWLGPLFDPRKKVDGDSSVRSPVARTPPERRGINFRRNPSRIATEKTKSHQNNHRHEKGHPEGVVIVS
jgi:hypothetical protein